MTHDQPWFENHVATLELDTRSGSARCRYGRTSVTGGSAAGSCVTPSPGSVSLAAAGSSSASSKRTKRPNASTSASAGRSSPGLSDTWDRNQHHVPLDIGPV